MAPQIYDGVSGNDICTVLKLVADRVRDLDKFITRVLPREVSIAPT